MTEANVEFTGERFVTGCGGPQIAGEHAHRYMAAGPLVRGKRVLDLGCGTGYGADLLSGFASYLGIDIDPAAVSAATERFGAESVGFAVGDVMSTQLDAGSFDVVLSFEVVEHVADPAAVILEAKRLLAPGGLILVSTPDKIVYNANRDEPNPFHPSELTRNEFRALLDGNFAHCRFWGQRFTTCSAIYDPGAPVEDGSVFLPGDAYGSTPPPMYWLGLASDSPLPVFRPGALVLAEERDLGAELVTAVQQLRVYEEIIEERTVAMQQAQAAEQSLSASLAEAREKLHQYEAALGPGEDLAVLRDRIVFLESQNATLQRRYDYIADRWAKFTLQKWRRPGFRRG